MLIDSHCHIEKDEVAERAYAAGVAVLLNAGKDLDVSVEQVLMCRKFNVQAGKSVMWTSAGVHPDSAAEKLGKITVEDIVAFAESPEVIAIGECGLDYHYGAEYQDEQKEMFRRHVEAAGMTSLPLMKI